MSHLTHCVVDQRQLGRCSRSDSDVAADVFNIVSPNVIIDLLVNSFTSLAARPFIVRLHFAASLSDSDVAADVPFVLVTSLPEKKIYIIP